MMREHMLANMRDHLLALQQITAALAGGDYDRAADVAERRLGMSSLEGHGAAHLARFMPPGMAASGTAMHRAASRFALAARDADVDGGLAPAFAALSGVMEQCVACHNEDVPIEGYTFDYEAQKDEGTHENFPLKYDHSG